MRGAGAYTRSPLPARHSLISGLPITPAPSPRDGKQGDEPVTPSRV